MKFLDAVGTIALKLLQFGHNNLPKIKAEKLKVSKKLNVPSEDEKKDVTLPKTMSHAAGKNMECTVYTCVDHTVICGSTRPFQSFHDRKAKKETNAISLRKISSLTTQGS